MKTKISIPKGLGPKEREAIAYEVIEAIIERTQKGKDKNGDRFNSYSKSYKESLNFKIGGKTNKVDLTLSGDMLADLQLLKHKNGEIVIGYENGTESNAKAEGNIRGTYGQKTPDERKAKDFLGIQKKELSQILELYPADDRKSRIARAGEIAELMSGADTINGRIILEELDDED